MLCIQLKSDVSHMIVDRIYFFVLFPVVSGGKVGYNFSTIRFVLGFVWVIFAHSVVLVTTLALLIVLNNWSFECSFINCV